MVKKRTDQANNIDLINSVEEKSLVDKITRSYRAAWMNKDSQGCMNRWSKAQDYWAGDVNESEDEDDPGSETNIVQPIIESQVADLVDGQMDFMVKGGPSEKPYVNDEKQRLKWIWYQNKMIPKLDEGERDRLNLGVIGWKVFFDTDALNGRGLVAIEPRSPDTLFPDPKVKDKRYVDRGDYFIEVMPQPLSYLKRRFGKRGQLVKPEGQFRPYDPQIFGENTDAVTEIVNDQALLYEYWEMADDDDGNTALRRVYMAGSIILEDSDWTHKNLDGTRKPFYKHNRYPYIMIPCYNNKGTLWGKGDNEQLWNTQDLINELDDQIRMNARLMGNTQIVVGTQAGINLKKWTNKPGLKIPAKDHTAWEVVQPASIPAFIYQRRQQGFTESEIISGRSDVTEGRRSGSLRAASAIMALQEAGNRRANHKKLMLQEGFVEVLELASMTMREFMVNESEFDTEERDGSIKHLWSRPSDMNNIPVKTLNENYNGLSDQAGTEMYKDLLTETRDENDQIVYEEDGKTPRMETMMKEAEFRFEFSFGAGMPNNPSFLYQSAVELTREGLITQEEGREVLKQALNWPVIDPQSPQGQFVGRNMSADQLNIVNGMPQSPEQLTPQQEPQPNSPDDLNAITEVLGQLPPEQMQALLSALMAVAGGGIQ